MGQKRNFINTGTSTEIHEEVLILLTWLFIKQDLIFAWTI